MCSDVLRPISATVKEIVLKSSVDLTVILSMSHVNLHETIID